MRAYHVRLLLLQSQLSVLVHLYHVQLVAVADGVWQRLVSRLEGAVARAIRRQQPVGQHGETQWSNAGDGWTRVSVATHNKRDSDERETHCALYVLCCSGERWCGVRVKGTKVTRCSEQRK